MEVIFPRCAGLEYPRRERRCVRAPCRGEQNYPGGPELRDYDVGPVGNAGVAGRTGDDGVFAVEIEVHIAPFG